MNPTALLLLLLMSGFSGILEVDASPGHQTSHISRNIALGASAEQSSTRNEGYAYRAVDGSKETDFNVRPCTHTNLDVEPWWRVDLGRVYKVTRVAVTNRGDCCSENLNGAQIRIGSNLDYNGNNNRVAAFIERIPKGQTKTYKMAPTEGRYVNIYIPENHRTLTLCEVEVFADEDDDSVPNPRFDKENLSNVAQKGRATQSSLQTSGTWGGIGMAQNAIDGNRNPDLAKGSCTLTARETSPWWRVDLLHKHIISIVGLTNRGDCCSEDLNGAEIRIGNSLENDGRNNTLCATVSSISAGQTEYFRCVRLLNGRYVTIVLPGEGSLSLCEVEVFALPKLN